MHEPIDAEEPEEVSLTQTWKAAGIDLEKLQVDPGGTMTPLGWNKASAATLREDLPPEMSAVEEGGGPLGFDLTSSEKLALGAIIGEGGSGVVYLARQPALARDVAIKVITDDEDGAALEWLLREARVTGALEHPNIVPIHDIGRHEDGRPMIVMKRIEGQGWDRILAEEREATAGDPAKWGAFLDRHLRILVQVARAVGFAHARGILHRDIKPENVMLGPFGEVYLVDWDIAATFEGDLVPGLPKTQDINDLFGTPGYMAPEMVSCSANVFGPRTDVYLLGATLCEVLKGVPPHRAPDLVQSLTQSYQSEPPPFDESVDTAIVEVCHRAMARKPKDRIASAEGFALEVESYLSHRHSLTLSRAGQNKLLELEAVLEALDLPALAAGASLTGEAAASAHQADERIAQLYRECRFLFQQARNIWPENQDAFNGFGEATDRVVRYELHRGRPDAARAILDDLRVKREALVVLVEQALAAKRDGEAELRGMAHDRDVHVGQRARSIGAGLLSLGSVALNVACGVMAASGASISHVEYGVAHLLNLVWAVTIVVLLRRAVWSTTANRQISITTLVTITSYVGIMILGRQLGLAFNDTLVLMAFILGIIWLVGTLAFDKRLVVLPIIAFAEMPLIHLFPQAAFWILGAAIGLGLICTALILMWSDRRAAA